MCDNHEPRIDTPLNTADQAQAPEMHSEQTTRPFKRRKKVIFPFHYSKSKKLVHIVIRLRDVPGSLAGVLAMLTTRVNIIGSTSYSIEGNAAIFSCFAETLRKSDSASALQDLVTMSNWALESQITESLDGLLVDSFHTGVQIGLGDPYIMLPSAGMSGAFEELVRTFGSGGETILYNLGLRFGTDRYQILKPVLGPRPSERMPEAAHIFEALGYGSSTISREVPGEVLRLVVEDCFECSTPSEIGRSCAFRRGLAVGAFGAVFGMKLACEETRCRLKGDEVCEFVLTADNKKAF